MELVSLIRFVRFVKLVDLVRSVSLMKAKLLSFVRLLDT